MNRSKWFWFRVPVALALLASIALLANGYLSFPASLLTTGTTGTREGAATQSGVKDSAKVQEMIDSGQFAPPPGNPEKIRSMIPTKNVKVPATIAKHGNLAVSTQAQVQKKPQSQLIEFETPPGVGSNKGGK